MSKILYVASIEKHILSFHLPFISMLRQKGHEIHVAASLESGEGRRYGAIWHHISFARSPLSPLNISAFFRLVSLMRREKYDLVHVHTPVAALLGRMAAWFVNGSRVLYTVHGFHFYQGAPLLNWMLFYPIEKLARCWTDAILVMNREDLMHAVRLGYEQDLSLFWIPGVGVDLDRYGSVAGVASPAVPVLRSAAIGLDFAIGPDTVIFTCVAELIPRKNIPFLLQAWARVSEALPDAHLCLVGTGPEEETLKRWVTEKRVERVYFMGFRRDVPVILWATDVFVLVSTQEGLPRGTLEAMAAGLPVIVSLIRGHVDLVEDGQSGLQVELGDVERLVEAMNELGLSASLRRAMGEEARKQVAMYALPEVVVRMDDIYRRFLPEGDTR